MRFLLGLLNLLLGLGAVLLALAVMLVPSLVFVWLAIKVLEWAGAI